MNLQVIHLNPMIRLLGKLILSNQKPMNIYEVCNK